MATLSKVLMQLRKERQRASREVARIEEAIAAVKKLTTRDGAGREGKFATRRPRRKLSAAGRKRIAAAQRARWAKLKARRAKKSA